MNQAKTSSKINSIFRAVATAAVLPVLFIYIMVAKPDYKIMNMLSYIVLPVAEFVGDVVTWPFRAVGNLIENISETSNLRAENEELRAKLDMALINKNNCDIAIAENKRLEKELDIKKHQPYDMIVADIIHDNSAIGHRTFIINRGEKDGIKQGMAVVSTDMKLVGIIADSANNFSRVRSLTDSDTNIAVRVAGSEVYGFLTGNGSARPTIGFLSDPEFQPTNGIHLITSNISGILPAGILVGTLTDKKDVNIVPVSTLSRVMILKFNTPQNEYK